jgi:hypothetical protein
MLNILEWVADKATKYKDLIKLGTSASKAYLDYKDAKRKGELQEAAYADYMAQAAAAGEEAQAAVDIGLTPMTVTNVPETKADVSSFTKLAARGGLMSIPNRQRKRYATGPDEVDVMEFDEEVITPDYLMKEEGVNIGPMASGKYSQEEIEAYENYKYEMNEQKPGFPIMEIDEFLRFWYSAVKGEENIKMASAPDPMDERNSMANMLFNKNLDELTETQLIELDEAIANSLARGGIAGLKKGGRVKYAQGSGIMNLGGLEKDYRTTGGFVPIGEYEKKDDVPARLSKNEFVMTADAVRAAGGGSINKGAQRMYNTMKHLEAQPQAKRMTA